MSRILLLLALVGLLVVSPGTADDPDDSDEDDPSDEDDDAPDGMWGRGRGYARWRRQCCNRCGNPCTQCGSFGGCVTPQPQPGQCSPSDPRFRDMFLNAVQTCSYQVSRTNPFQVRYTDLLACLQNQEGTTSRTPYSTRINSRFTQRGFTGPFTGPFTTLVPVPFRP